MLEITHKVDEVFGISRDLPLNYTPRDQVDNALIDNLTRDRHLVIYGSSKQGKTSLRKNCLKDSDSIVVQCSNKWSLSELHAAILKQAGFEIAQSQTRSISGKNKIIAKVVGSFLGIGGEGGGEKEWSSETSVTKVPLELDPEDVNDIISALGAFNKFIVLEDFHYLSIDTQKDFAVALKAFHEKSKICFIVVGVWLEEGRLTVYNGDLTGRIFAINADKWTVEELLQVIEAGEQLLNIEFDKTFIKSLLHECFDSVYIVQEVCHRCCRNEKVFETQPVTRKVGVGQDAKQFVKEVVNQQGGRYKAFLTQFADGFQDTSLQMYRWLLLPVLLGDVRELERGLKLSAIRKLLQANHPISQSTGLNYGNITQALQSAASLQASKDIKPIILDYDQTNTQLNVVDRGFLIWLANQERDELLEIIELPKKNQVKPVTE